MYKKIITWIMPVLLILAVGAAGWAAAGGSKTEKRVVCTTFPIYLITKNVARGSTTVRVELMLPAAMGCPHDYTLKPEDMRKLAQADCLVVNGLGLEEFLGAPVHKANPTIRIIDSSEGSKDLLQYTDAEEDGHRHESHSGDRHARQPEHGHSHAGVNPHLFASPRRAAVLAETIARGLGEQDPGNAELYSRNAREYAGEMNDLADAFSRMGGRLKNNRIVTQHGAFDYLAHDMGLEIVAVVAAHGGQEPSAAELLNIVKTIREKRAGAIFTEPQYPPQIGRRLAEETGIPSAVLDPVATGPEDAGLNYYQQVMRKNLEVLEKTLGVR